MSNIDLSPGKIKAVTVYIALILFFLIIVTPLTYLAEQYYLFQHHRLACKYSKTECILIPHRGIGEYRYHDIQAKFYGPVITTCLVRYASWGAIAVCVLLAAKKSGISPNVTMVDDDHFSINIGKPDNDLPDLTDDPNMKKFTFETEYDNDRDRHRW
ncbi:hypothetical protein [Persicirhabdus sediminis]|uniref:Uncharacterized protein n=1 Tax=Persicirhabdus sediminis TaxID=454144 RepID=A0A8J7MF99_9BACT|nr:hypothetical protein [Persicirhabdus sediminis]MBK1792212.1 hypothetical protein [Persicirhabdus sediminis]